MNCALRINSYLCSRFEIFLYETNIKKQTKDISFMKYQQRNKLNMKKLMILALVAVLAMGNIEAKEKMIVWQNPTTEYGSNYGDGYFYPCIEILKVELKDNETNLYFHISYRSDYPDCRFRFSGGMFLKADGKMFPLVSADGLALDTDMQTGKDGTLDAVFHFKPLPLTVKKFDWIEGEFNGAAKYLGIRSAEDYPTQLFDSYWRNEKTGNWDIAFFNDFVIYDCRFWDYKNISDNEMTVSNGNDELKIVTGKEKNGKRTIQIGDKSELYSRITGRFLPDYPTKDTRTDFVDINYKTDVVTLVGWVKDMPEQLKGNKVFTIHTNDIVLDDQMTFSCDLDSIGRFMVKMPIPNTTDFSCDWERCFLRTMFEPGKTYFMLYDYKEGKRLFMGEDARLQNELFRFPLDWKQIRMEQGMDEDRFVDSVDSLLKAQYQYIDDLCAAHPTLSTRFEKYRKGHTLSQQARTFGQARFAVPEHKLSERSAKYAYDNFWTRMEKPYSLHQNTRTFIRDYLEDAIANRNNSVSLLDYIDEIAENEDELAHLYQYKAWVDSVETAVIAEPDMEKKQKIVEEANVSHDGLIKKIDPIFARSNVIQFAQEKLLSQTLDNQILALDSLGADEFIKDITIAYMAFNQIDHGRRPLSDKMMERVKSMIKNQMAFQYVFHQNETYLALEKKEFDRASLHSNDDVKGISEGEALLKKLVEPYKGKLVLIDVWGTWCGPCKAAMANSKEEYERLAPYDMVFLYLANNSPQDSWENVIKEYGVTGDNVVHYNLPAQQQDAIERFLKVQAFPTYKLVDKEGNILDINADPRDLNAFEEFLKRVLEK